MLISPNFKSLCSLPPLLPSVVENIKWRRVSSANGECLVNTGGNTEIENMTAANLNEKFYTFLLSITKKRWDRI
jgi:hypothetical protein